MSLPRARHLPVIGTTCSQSARPRPFLSHPLSGGRCYVSSSQEGRDSQILNLRDGRTLGFAEYGAAKGFPVFFLHGWPSSRLEPYSLDGLAKKLDVHLISPDRPGFGLSTFAPRTFLEFAKDVEELANALKLERFAMIGASGGGPFVLACAKVMPRRRLAALGLFASAGPWRMEVKQEQSASEREEEQALRKEVMLVQRFIAFGAHNAPNALCWLSDASVWFLRHVVRTALVSKQIDAFLMSQHPREEHNHQLLEGYKDVASEREQMLRAIFEAYEQGCRGAIHEARLLTSPWMCFEDYDYPGIRIWHGSKDTNAPTGQIRYMAHRLRGAVLYEYKEDNHFRLAGKLGEAIEELVAVARA